MRSSCSLSDNALRLEHGDHIISSTANRVSKDCVLPIASLWHIISYLSPSVILFQNEEHFCSPRYPCCLARPAIRSFLPLRLVCHTFNLMCRLLFPQYTIEETWWPEMWDPSIWHSLLPVVMAKHFEGKYRHFVVLAGHHAWNEGCSVAYDTGTPFGCDKARMPLVVIKVLVEEEPHAAERNSYSAIRRVMGTEVSSGFPGMLSCSEFSLNELPSKRVVYYLISQYLGPTLHDVLMNSYYTRFTSKMTMAVAIQLLRRYQAIHSIQLIHTGAKPANFCLPPFSRGSSGHRPSDPIFMIDFGFSSFYTPPPEGAEKPDDWATANWNFRSLRSEGGFSVSPRDDMESLAYVLAYLGKGKLPWHSGPKSKYGFREQASKSKATGALIFDGMDPVYQWPFEIGRALEWGAIPVYDLIISRFSERWVAKGFGANPGEFQWHRFGPDSS
ncbi:hypothetical protein SISNIDRAFT_268190 [Sistotremastrum niveocremeum HHB9708]|uniref:Protein kinase domain-containing protein n=1 Tax=Sistotremastrum niveocremeum HHB9708 TaxID=1314777 RepID=A0A164NZ54_9AGAM|nr:hypothetical protein SISNIDRAFT_268190 [Sistotremastrum niveocremeum HHB9708]